MAESGCWEWVAEKSPHGYGQFWNGERLVRPHRWLYAYLYGDIAAGMVLDHLCRNPPCVNPGHMEPVTPSENARRGLKGSLKPPAPVREVCGRGHSLAEYGHQRWGRPVGQMECRECRRQAWHGRKGAA